MKHLLTMLATAALGAAALGLAVPAHATLTCTITVDGSAIASCPASGTGTISFAGADAPLFSSITLTGDGSPNLPQPDLSTVTLDVSSAATFTGSHVLGVDIFQTGVAAPVGATLQTTATINGLINLPGPTTLSDAFNGTSTTLGTTLRSSTFAATFTGAIGPFLDVLGVPLTADAQQYLITFTAPNQSANDTIQLQGISPLSVPEPSSLGMLGVALLGLGLVYRRRQAR
jgi:methionine-rich copper-binding protein CopC